MLLLLLLLLWMLAGSGTLAAAAPLSALVPNELAPRVDTRIELLSVVFRLAGSPEFVQAPASSYLHDVDRHFAAHAHHPLIAYVRALSRRLKREGQEVDAWTVLSLAVHLDPAPGFGARVPYGAAASEDSWDNRLLLTPKFVELLQRFYRDAHCAEFFGTKARDFEAIEQVYRAQGLMLNTQWLDALFALSPTERYQPVLSLFGVADFGYLRVNYDRAGRDTYTVIAVPARDASGRPGAISAEAIARMALHEYIHAFTNQLIDRHMPEMRAAAETLVRDPEVASRVRGRFYDNPPFLVYESLVRACSIVYLTHNPGIVTTRDKEIAAQEQAGFLWMRGLVDLLDAFAEHQPRDRSMEALMPQIVQYFDGIARRSAAP